MVSLSYLIKEFTEGGRISMIQYKIVTEEGKKNVLFAGDIDIESTEVIEDEIMPALQECNTVELNLASVPFVDSTGIGLLIKVVQTLKENGTIVTITNICDDIFEVFTFLQLPEILGKEVFLKS